MRYRAVRPYIQLTNIWIYVYFFEYICSYLNICVCLYLNIEPQTLLLLRPIINQEKNKAQTKKKHHVICFKFCGELSLLGLLFKEAFAIWLIDCIMILLRLITLLCCLPTLMAMSCYFRLCLRVQIRTLCVYGHARMSVFANRKPVHRRLHFFFV